MKRHDSDDSPVAAKLQRFGSFRRKALYEYGLFIISLLFSSIIRHAQCTDKTKSKRVKILYQFVWLIELHWVFVWQSKRRKGELHSCQAVTHPTVVDNLSNLIKMLITHLVCTVLLYYFVIYTSTGLLLRDDNLKRRRWFQ